MSEKMNISTIAGFCNEQALCKLLVDLASNQIECNPPKWMVPAPEFVMVDGDDFKIDANGVKKQTTEFYPPEGSNDYAEASFVWSLGALVCYASSGHYVFGGRGGAYQHDNPDVDLPTLRKEHSALTPIVKRCLCFSPSERISLKELRDLAVKGLESNNQMSRLKRSIESSEMIDSPECIEEVWSEKMV